jgi:hypothetical protein
MRTVVQWLLRQYPELRIGRARYGLRYGRNRLPELHGDRRELPGKQDVRELWHKLDEWIFVGRTFVERILGRGKHVGRYVPDGRPE